MLGLQNYIRNNEELRLIADGIESNLKEQLLSGLSGSARTVVMATLYRETKRTQLVVTHNLYQANVWRERQNVKI